MAKAPKKRTTKKRTTKKRTTKGAKKRTTKRAKGKRVTLAASTLDKLISVGAGHHAALVRLRRMAKPVGKKPRRKRK